MRGAAVLQIDGLRVERGGEHLPASGTLEVTLAAGECLMLAGHSGSGKSTLLLAPFGLAPGEPRVTGHCRLEGISFAAGTLPPAVRPRIAFVLQEPGDNFAPGLRLLPQLFDAAGEPPGDRLRAAAAQLARALGLGDLERYARQVPAHLARGEVQRFALLAALLRRPAVLIADEPTAALDAANAARWCAVVNRARREYGLAVCLAAHEAGVASELSARVIEVGAPAVLTQRALATASRAEEATPRPGELRLVTGPSGSGKTTLLEGIARRGARTGAAGEVAMVFQTARAGLNPYRSVGASLAAAFGLRGAAAGVEAAACIDREFHLLGLAPSLSRRLPQELSVGQAQRVALVLALASRPRLLLCDEPTSALGAGHRERVGERLLAALASGTGLVVASHDPILLGILASARDCRQLHLPQDAAAR